MRFITLTTLDDSYQAYFLKKALEDEGIRCIVANEHTSTALPIPGPIGAMIQVRIAEVDLEAATKVLDKLKTDTDPVVCPNCGSRHVRYGFGGRNKLWSGLVLLFGILVSSLAVKFHFLYSCRDCGTEFRKNKY